MADNVVAHVCSFDVLVGSCGGRKQIIRPAEQAAGGGYFWSRMDGWKREQSNWQQNKAIYSMEIWGFEGVELHDHTRLRGADIAVKIGSMCVQKQVSGHVV